MSERITGTVKWFSRAKGYGFINQLDGPDVCPCPTLHRSVGGPLGRVHFSAIAGEGYRSLSAGQSVSFRVEDSARGLQAVDVQPL